MSDPRRYKPVNKVGCKPTEDVCVEHDTVRVCRHGCKYALPHKCQEFDEYLKSEPCEAPPTKAPAK